MNVTIDLSNILIIFSDLTKFFITHKWENEKEKELSIQNRIDFITHINNTGYFLMSYYKKIQSDDILYMANQYYQAIIKILLELTTDSLYLKDNQFDFDLCSKKYNILDMLHQYDKVVLWINGLFNYNGKYSNEILSERNIVFLSTKLNYNNALKYDTLKIKNALIHFVDYCHKHGEKYYQPKIQHYIDNYIENITDKNIIIKESNEILIRNLSISYMKNNLDDNYFHIKNKEKMKNNYNYSDTKKNIENYEKFMKLLKITGESLVPSKKIDEIAHLHMLKPLDYYNYCLGLVGTIIDHDNINKENLKDDYKRTKELWKKYYKEELEDEEGFCRFIIPKLNN